MPSMINDPDHWRARAEAARALAELLSDKLAKRTMLRIAKDFDRLAKRAESRTLAPEDSTPRRKRRDLP
jgi:hypothetical protein